MAALTIDPAVLTPRGVIGRAEPQSEFDDDVIAAINDHAALIDGGAAGDIQEVIAGTNLTGGGTSGSVTVNLNPVMTGITSITATADLAIAAAGADGDISITAAGTGNVTVTGEVAQTSAAAASSGAKFTKTTVGSPTSYMPAVHGVNNGSYDTTAAALNAVAVFGECNASISAGANGLFVSGVYGYDDGGSNATDRYGIRGVTAATAGTNIYAGGFTNLSTANTYKWAVAGTAQGNNGTKYGGYFGASGTGTNWALYTTTGDVALNVSGGDAYMYGGLIVAGAEKITSIISPAALGAADNPNYAPTGFATARILRLAGDAGGASTLSGIAGGQAGRIITICNVSAFVITTLAASGLSTAGNRFITGKAIAAGLAQSYLWDTTSADWREV